MTELVGSGGFSISVLKFDHCKHLSFFKKEKSFEYLKVCGSCQFEGLLKVFSLQTCVGTATQTAMKGKKNLQFDEFHKPFLKLSTRLGVRQTVSSRNRLSSLNILACSSRSAQPLSKLPPNLGLRRTLGRNAKKAMRTPIFKKIYFALSKLLDVGRKGLGRVTQ